MKRANLLAVVIFCLTLLCGCGGREIDDMAYVVAIGVDESEYGYEFTFAIGNPGSINGGGGEASGGGDSNALILESQSSSNIFSAGDAVSARIGQEINFSHAELLVFSEKVAFSGVDKFFDSLTRNLSQRPKLVPAVSAKSAKDVLSAINSEFEGNPEKYLKKVFENGESAVSVNINSRKFLCQTKNIDSGSVLPRIDSGEWGIGVNSLSVFAEDAMVGAFDDVFAYKMLCGDIKDISFDVSDKGTLILNRRAKPAIDVYCGEKPEISVRIILDSTLASISEGMGKEELISMAEKQIEDRINSILIYSSYDVGTDVFGFDPYAKKGFLDLKSWEKYNWREKYKSALFDVKAEIRPEKTGLLKGEK